MKLVTVVVPVYGVEKYINEALLSVIQQTYSALEIIVVNDGTTDSSMEIVKSYDDKRIRIVEQDNQGLAAARNRGIAASTGEFIALLDPDDIWMPDKIEVQMAHLKSKPEVGVSYGISQMIDEEGFPTGFFQKYKTFQIGPADLLIGNPLGNGSSPLIRYEAFKELSTAKGETPGLYFDTKFKRCEDLDCWLRLCLKTRWKFEGIPNCLVKYRLRASGLSGDFIAQSESFEQLLEKLNDYAPDFVSQFRHKAVARQLRNGACRALRKYQSDMATNYIVRAIKADPRILLDLPLRVFSIFVRVFLQKILPQYRYVQLERLVGKMITE